MRRLAAESIVLLKNDGDILPLKPKVSIGPCQPHLPCVDISRQEQGLKKIAIVGGNAKAIVLSGGGSAALKPSYFTNPYDGLVAALKEADPSVEITYSEGARATMLTPSLDYEIFTHDGRRGWIGEWYKHENDESMKPVGGPIKEQYIDETRMFFR